MDPRAFLHNSSFDLAAALAAIPPVRVAAMHHSIASHVTRITFLLRHHNATDATDILLQGFAFGGQAVGMENGADSGISFRR